MVAAATHASLATLAVFFFTAFALGEAQSVTEVLHEQLALRLSSFLGIRFDTAIPSSGRSGYASDGREDMMLGERAFANPGRSMPRTWLVSLMQSMLEEQSKQVLGHRRVQPEMHETISLIDDALQMLSRTSDHPHASRLGYALTIIEAVAFATNFTQRLGIHIPRDTVTAQNFLTLVTLLRSHGPSSDVPRTFYDRALAMEGENQKPVDAGWINEYIGTLGTYVEAGGVHAYRKVPDSASGGYDVDFAVYNLPKEKDRPLVIGVLADWGCGTPESHAVLAELQQQNPDVIIHLGDTYYSGTRAEAREFWLEPMRAAFGDSKLILQIPGNHDYYSEGGAGFFEVIDELGHQNASCFVLRGEHWQILAIDTGLLNDFNLLLPLGPESLRTQLRSTMTFLPPDQVSWAREQLELGRKRGLKTIMMSHHQLFSRKESVGAVNGVGAELAFLPDQIEKRIGWLKEFRTRSEDLPGALPSHALPAVNTRLLSQFPPEILEGVSVWFWGHEHSTAIFEPYAGLQRGRLIGHGCIPFPKDIDMYKVSSSTNATPWGGHPEVIPGSRVGTGDNFWNIGFVTVTLDGDVGHARYFQLQDQSQDSGPQWGPARLHFEERI